MKTSIDNTIQDQKVLLEQIKILSQGLLPVVAMNLVFCAVLPYGLWDVASHTALIVWVSLIVSLVAIRSLLYFFYRRRIDREHVQSLIWHFVSGSAVSGVLWGIGLAVLFPAGQLEYQLFLLFILAGMGTGSLLTLNAYLPAFFAYFPTAMLPVGVVLFFADDPIHISLGIMTFVFIILLSYIGVKANRTLKESLRLRFENIDLVEQLRDQKDEAERANAAKSKFLAAASHDLRQPLYALTLFTSVLDESIKLPKNRKIVDRIKASVEALKNLFDALLDISQLDAGVIKVEKTDFPLQPLFEKLDNDFSPQSREKGLRFIWPTCAYAVHTDQNLFEQILRNYISNAIRYTDSGEVRITCETDGRLIVINVIDTGIGIPVAEQQVIFEEFHQLSNPERDRSKGLGLGLAIVQRTASLLGHSINVASQPSKGSTFSITLEQANISERDGSVGPEVENNTKKEGTFMIVIDDEASVREGTQSLLELWGCDVIAAADKKEAMTQLRRQNRSPDGIIADYRLRENQTGIDAIRAIHVEYNDKIPALIVTGDIAVDNLREVNRSGFQVLHKPVTPVKLRSFLHNVQSHQ